MRARIVLITTGLAAGLLAWPLGQPASAAVTPAIVGSTVTVAMTGDGAAEFGCSGGNVAVNGTVVAPGLACASLTKAIVTGDAGSQTVVGEGLDAAAFAAGPTLTANTGDGTDSVYETLRSDTFHLGAGLDTLLLKVAGTTNAVNDLGADNDHVTLSADGGSTPVNITITSTGTTATLTSTVGATNKATVLTDADFLIVEGGAGNDTLSSLGVTAASSIDFVALYAGPGNDTLTGGPVTNTLLGGTGTNVFNGGDSTFYTESPTDTLVDGPEGSGDLIYDRSSLHSGGRTLTGFDDDDTLQTYAPQADTVARVRPGAVTGSLRETLSLNRSGRQDLAAGGIGAFTVSYGGNGFPAHRTLTDVVTPSQDVLVSGQSAGPDLLDVTVPTGSWNQVGGAGSWSIDTGDPGLGSVTASNVDALQVHGPWTDANQGFAHRATRDLLFRFATPAARDAIRDQLTAGTRTRAQVVASLVDTDEYRGLDVDRVFVSYLRRVSDPGGRTYWINSLRNGKSLRQFRAQLFGSSEYFTKAGGTNEQYMVAAYADVLGRLPDPSGQAYWTNKLNNGANRGAVAKQFLASTEARRNIVDDQFLRFLDRTATTTEQDEWITILGTSVNGEQGLVSALAASTSYYNRT